MHDIHDTAREKEKNKEKKKTNCQEIDPEVRA